MRRTPISCRRRRSRCRGGRFVKLADLGEVQDSLVRAAHARQDEWAPGRHLLCSAGQGLVRSYGLRRGAGRSCRAIEKENPKVHFSEIFNTVDYTKAQYRSAMEGLIEGAVLAVLVVLLFLRDIRATAISAIAIPLSAIPAFAFMSMMGITLNFMSTMAMGLVAGVLVDDAIVEIENIVRHMRMGKSGYQASLDAADEIGLAVLATTMAIVAVFLPVALMPGIAGQYFKAFGFTVVLSVLMSLLVARMITPLDRRLFPALAWRPAARELEVDGFLSQGSQLEPRHDQGRCAAGKTVQAGTAGSVIMRVRALLVLLIVIAGSLREPAPR